MAQQKLKCTTYRLNMQLSKCRLKKATITVHLNGMPFTRPVLPISSRTRQTAMPRTQTDKHNWFNTFRSNRNKILAFCFLLPCATIFFLSLLPCPLFSYVVRTFRFFFFELPGFPKKQPSLPKGATVGQVGRWVALGEAGPRAIAPPLKCDP